MASLRSAIAFDAMNASARGRRVAGLLLAAFVLAGCHEARELAEPPVVYADVEPILEEHCVECHSGPSAEADYRLEDYFQTIRCIPDPDGQPATLPSDRLNISSASASLSIVLLDNFVALFDNSVSDAWS